MIHTVASLFENRVATVKIIGGADIGFPPVFFSFERKLLLDCLRSYRGSGSGIFLIESLVGWSGVCSSNITRICQIALEDPSILPDKDPLEEWAFDREDAEFILENMNNRILRLMLDLLEDEARSYIREKDEIIKIIELFLRYESCKTAPKICECANPTASVFGNEEAANCNCCKHLQMVGEWDPEYCSRGCLYEKFPQWTWGLWELVDFSHVPIAGGMSFTFKIGIDEFYRFVRKTRVLEEYKQDELYELCKYMLSKWDEYREEGTRFTYAEVEKVWELDAVNKNE